MTWKSIFRPTRWLGDQMEGHLQILRGRTFQTMSVIVEADVEVTPSSMGFRDIQRFDGRFRWIDDRHNEHPQVAKAKDLIQAYYAGHRDKPELHTWLEV